MAHSPRSAIRPKQSLGQNFLVDGNIVRNIVRDMHLQPDDVVLEIGAGTGALTAQLVNHVRHLIVVEIDGRVISQLKSAFSSPSVTILHEDVLLTDFTAISRQMKCRLRVAGNLPYHLTSPILFRLFEHTASVNDATFMVQREVARRIVARPGSREYGILSVMTKFHGDAEMLFDVSPSCFYPKPKVTSTVLRLVFSRTGGVPGTDPALFSTIVRTAFGKRRKTLRNSLQYLPFGEPVVDRLLSEIRFPLEKRPEELSLDEFIRLVREIAEGLKQE